MGNMDFPRDRTPEHRQQPPQRPTLEAGPAPPLPWWRRATVRFEVLTASVVVLAMLLLTALMTYQISTSARQAIMAASSDSAHRVSLLVSERMHRIVDPADATLRLLAFDPVTTAPTLAQRLRRLPVLVRLLHQNQLLSAVYVGYPDGQFLLVRPLRNAALRAQEGAPPPCRVFAAVRGPGAGQRGAAGRALELLRCAAGTREHVDTPAIPL